jgi:hypothetical protein
VYATTNTGGDSALIRRPQEDHADLGLADDNDTEDTRTAPAGPGVAAPGGSRREPHPSADEGRSNGKFYAQVNEEVISEDRVQLGAGEHALLTTVNNRTGQYMTCLADWAHLDNWIVARYPTRFDAAVGHRAWLDWLASMPR